MWNFWGLYRLKTTNLNTWVSGLNCRIWRANLISETLRSSHIERLPVRSYVPPPDLRRKAALLRGYKDSQGNPRLPIHQDANRSCRNRLLSRRSITRNAKDARVTFRPHRFGPHSTGKCKTSPTHNHGKRIEHNKVLTKYRISR